jgi:PAS domain S-box-containing protein
VNNRGLLTAAVLLVGIGLTIVAGWLVGHYNKRAQMQQVVLQTDNATYAVHVALDRVGIAVQAVRALYAADWVTPDQFSRFGSTLASGEAIRSLAFYRRVTREARARYESNFDTEPARTLGIWQNGTDGKPMRAPDKLTHFVVESGYLLSGSKPTFGLDVTALAGREQAILKAIGSRGLVVSEPLRFVDSRTEGVLVYAPTSDRSGSVVGVAAGSISLEELASVAARASGADDVSIASPAEAPEGKDEPGPADKALAPNQRQFAYGGRIWSVTVTPRPPAGDFARWAMILIVGAGLAATAAVLAYLSNLAKTADVVEARARLRGMLDGLGPLAWLLTSEGTIVNANRAAISAFGRAKEQGVGRPFWDLPLNGGDPDQTERLRQAVVAAAQAEDSRFDLPVEQDEGRRVFDLWIRPLASAYGDPNHLVASAVDVTARYESEETQRLLMRELDHRMKNTLQVIQAIVRRTARSHSTVDRFEQSLLGRVNAMSRAHELLAKEHWLGADIGIILKEEMATFDPGNAIEVGGPSVRLSPKAALSFALVAHELGTNASKYGALSSPGGKIAIRWRVDRDGAEPRLVLQWQESGGPKVTPPDERGFGSMLIERSIAYELDGDAKLEYRPEGLVCTISAPLRAIRPFGTEKTMLSGGAETGAMAAQ